MQIKNEYVIFANKLADLSDQIIQKYFRLNTLNVTDKNDNSPVTIADIEIETLLKEEIANHYPEHGVFGEEIEDMPGNSPYKWYIDPIDGTSSFISGKPIFTTLIALVYNDEPIYGLVSQAITGERWQGGDAFQSNFNGKNITSRKCDRLSNAILATTSPYLFNEEQLKKFNLLRKQTSYQKYGGVFLGGDAYNYVSLATGHIDIILEADLKPHDFLALMPIITSSGGIVTNWRGEKITSSSDGNILACGDKELHNDIIYLLNHNTSIM